MTENILPRLRGWLAGAPALQGVDRLWVDHAAAGAPAAGLWPQGVQVTARRQNLLGDTALRCRARFVLRVALPFVPGDEALAAQNAQRLLALRQWVARESAALRAPAFGDEPAGETLSAEAARLESLPNAGGEGTAVYAVTLAAEYTERLPAAG